MTTRKGTSRQGSNMINRVTLLKFLIIVFPMWVSAKFYSGPYMQFIRNYFAAIILIILIALICQLILAKAKETGLLICLFIVLSLVQIACHFMPQLLASLAFSIGKANFFGGEYSLNMIPYYGVGGFIGYFVLKQGRKA